MSSPNSGGRDGSVKIKSTEAGSTVTVTFPALPAGPGDPPTPPAQPEHVDVYDPVPDWALRRFEHAMPPLRVDVGVSPEGVPELVSAHA